MGDLNKIDNLLELYSKEFEALTKEYLDYNSHTNISAIRSEVEIYEKHYKDSLALQSWIIECLELVKGEPQHSNRKKIIDIGSGGGFPVLPLAIVANREYPGLQFVALDSVAKKTKFIEHAKETLGLANLNILTGRAETFAQEQEHRESYDLVLARAVANLPTLLEYCIPFLKPGALLIASKSAQIDEELASAENAFRELNAEITKVYKYDDKQLLFIKKLSKTSSKYPRAIGKPLKTPL